MKYENPFAYQDRLEPSTTLKYKENYIYPFHLPE